MKDTKNHNFWENPNLQVYSNGFLERCGYHTFVLASGDAQNGSLCLLKGLARVAWIYSKSNLGSKPRNETTQHTNLFQQFMTLGLEHVFTSFSRKCFSSMRVWIIYHDDKWEETLTVLSCFKHIGFLIHFVSLFSDKKMSSLDFSNHHVFTADGRNPAPSDMYENL